MENQIQILGTKRSKDKKNLFIYMFIQDMKYQIGMHKAIYPVCHVTHAAATALRTFERLYIFSAQSLTSLIVSCR